MSAEQSYRVVGIRADGSHRLLVGGVTQRIAENIAADVTSGVFANVVVEPDSQGPQPTSEGTRSVDLFPDSVQQPRSNAQ
jgi:hypothetical protein